MSGWEFFLLCLTVGLGWLSAWISACQTAIFALSDRDHQILRAKNPARAELVDRLLDRPDGTGSVLMLAEAVCTLPLIVILLHWLDYTAIDDAFPKWLVGAAAFVSIVGLCDIAPKGLALMMPVRIASAGAPWVSQLVGWLEPVCDTFESLCERLVSLLFSRGLQPLPHLTDEELETLIEIGRDEGGLGEDESGIVREILRLEGKPAKHCMTPRVDAFFINDDLTNSEAIALIRNKRLRRVPVRGQRVDDIEGILDSKEFLLNPGEHYTSQLQVPSFVPESMQAIELLKAFLHHRQHLAILLDEFGGVEGIVTLSDLVEELLGDEGIEPKRELYIEPLGPDRILAAGNARLDDISDALGWDFHTQDIESIGGLVIDGLGYLPRAGVRLVRDGWVITVRRASRKRIKEVLIERGGEDDTTYDLSMSAATGEDLTAEPGDEGGAAS